MILAAILTVIIAIPAPSADDDEPEESATPATTEATDDRTTTAEETTGETTTAPPPSPPPSPPPTVAQIVDGDTIRLDDGRRVRLVQVDTPEPREGECYAQKSRRALASLIPPGTEIRLAADPRLDRRDRFGRQLRYVFVGARNVNVALVRQGAAAPYFFNGERGRFADRLLAAAERARGARRGLWRACSATELDPFSALTARRPPPPPPPEPIAAPPPPAGGGGNCDPTTRGRAFRPTRPTLIAPTSVRQS